MMTPAGALMIEHRLIERMVRLMREQLQQVESEHTCDPQFVETVVDFLNNYADGCHHGKEENILFRELDARPLDAALRDLLQELLDEHVRGRNLNARLAEANGRRRDGDPEALGVIRQCLQELTELYPQHIAKEDKRFFVPVQEYFNKKDLAAMLERFAEFDRQLFHQHYREVVGQWEAARHPQ